MLRKTLIIISPLDIQLVEVRLVIF